MSVFILGIENVGGGGGKNIYLGIGWHQVGKKKPPPQKKCI